MRRRGWLTGLEGASAIPASDHHRFTPFISKTPLGKILGLPKGGHSESPEAPEEV